MSSTEITQDENRAENTIPRSFPPDGLGYVDSNCDLLDRLDPASVQAIGITVLEFEEARQWWIAQVVRAFGVPDGGIR